jgi:hypothetical protein
MQTQSKRTTATIFAKNPFEYPTRSAPAETEHVSGSGRRDSRQPSRMASGPTNTWRAPPIDNSATQPGSHATASSSVPGSRVAAAGAVGFGRGGRGFGGQAPHQTFLMTRESVIMGESNLWPVPWNLGGDGSRIVDVGQLSQTAIEPYLAGADMVDGMARFLVRIFLTPRAQIANYRNAIWESFEGCRAPSATPKRFMRDDGSETLSSVGSREMAKIHLAAVRRIREQILPAAPKRGGAKLPPGLRLKCPFGAGCLYLTYGTVLDKVLTVMGVKKQDKPKDLMESYVKYNVRSPRADGGFDYRPSMCPVKVYPDNCSCPYAHDDDEVDLSQTLSDKIITAMCSGMDVVVWRHANGALVSASPQVVRAAKPFYPIEAIRQALAALPEDERVLRLAICVLATLDNVSDPDLVPRPEGMASGPLPINDALDSVCKEELAQWRDDRDQNIEIPYLANFDYRAHLKLTREKKVAVNDRATSLRDQLRESSSHLDHSTEDTSPVPMADAQVGGTPGVDAAAPRAKSPTREADLEVDDVSVVHGGRGPIHGVRFVPRLVSDAYLREKGFSFSTHRGFESMEAADDYIFECLVSLYETYIPTFDGLQCRGLAQDVYLRHNGNPFALFDEGAAYLPLYRFAPIRDAY